MKKIEKTVDYAEFSFNKIGQSALSAFSGNGKKLWTAVKFRGKDEFQMTKKVD